MANTSKPHVDVYSRVTDQIVKAIEADAGEWKMPWHVSGRNFESPSNAVTGKRYRGVNVLSLWSQSQLFGYEEPSWATYRQWASLGHAIQKGEHATIGVFWKSLGRSQDGETNTDDAPDETSARRWLASAFPLFNAAQVEGYVPPPRNKAPLWQRIDRADRFFVATGANVLHGGDRAFYSPQTDHIQMPPYDAFSEPEAYYGILAHEATHWTAASKRLARDLSGRFGSEAYAAEELIAELGAAFISADLEICLEPRLDHAAYVQHWLKLLKNDNRAIFTAASHAQRAAEYLHALQSPEPEARLLVSANALTP